MLVTYARRSAAALLAAILTLSVVAISSAVAQTAEPDQAAVVAARDFLGAIDYRNATNTKIATIAQTKTALKVMLEREPILEEQVAKLYASRFTAEELSAASAFYRSPTGAVYRNFNREMSANPFTTPDSYRAAIASHFNPQQRAEVFRYLSAGVGQKMQRMLPDLTRAEKEEGDKWGVKVQELIKHAVRTGEQVS